MADHIATAETEIEASPQEVWTVGVDGIVKETDQLVSGCAVVLVMVA